MNKLDFYFVGADDAAVIKTLDDLNARLAAGRKIFAHHTLTDEIYFEFEFKAAKDTALTPTVMIHEIPARDLTQVANYLAGDAHDRSKIRWFNGKKWFDMA